MNALQMFEGNVAQAAKHLGVTPMSVRKRRAKLTKGILGTTEDYRKMRADIFADMQKMLLRFVTEDKLKKASLQQIGTLFGIFYDKERLERGQATEHIAHAHYEQLDDKSRKMLKDTIKKMTEQKLKQVSYNDD